MLLCFHESIAPLHLDRFGQVIGKPLGGRAGLQRIREDADALKLLGPGERQQLLELRIALAREADDERGAQRQPRDARAQIAEQFFRLSTVHLALHAAQHAIVDVLQRQVQVGHDLPRLGQCVDELVREVDRVGVKDADPLDALKRVEFAQKLREAHAAVQIQSVVGGVLSDQNQLADSIGRQFARFAGDLLDRLGDVLAAHAGDGAEGAQAIAAFGDLQVGIVPRRDPQARRVFERADRRRAKQAALLETLSQGAVDDLGDFFAAENADDVIDLGNLLEEVLLLAFGQAAGHDHRPHAPLLLERQHLANDAERFLPGRLDETAGVDNNHVGAVRVGSKCVPVLGQPAEHALRIDQVLGAAQADEGIGALNGAELLFAPWRQGKLNYGQGMEPQ